MPPTNRQDARLPVSLIVRSFPASSSVRVLQSLDPDCVPPPSSLLHVGLMRLAVVRTHLLLPSFLRRTKLFIDAFWEWGWQSYIDGLI